jgi:hypothetical protein
MAIYHLSVKPISRKGGRSATAAAAYRAGEKIHDLTTDQTFDYTRKRGGRACLPRSCCRWRRRGATSTGRGIGRRSGMLRMPSMATMVVVVGLSVSVLLWVLETWAGLKSPYAKDLVGLCVVMLGGFLGGVFWAVRGRTRVAAAGRGAMVFDGSPQETEFLAR